MLNILASFPKSGNTWVRIFLDAYLRDKEPDINDLLGTYTDSASVLYSIAKNIDFHALPLQKQVLMRPAALLRIYELASLVEYDTNLKSWPVIIKSHFSNVTIQTIRLFPPSIVGKTIYIVRDPRSVVISFAKHFGKTIDEAITSMLEPRYTLYDKNNPLAVSQYVGSWQQHVWTFATSPDFKVSVVRYEDLRENPEKYFKWILNWFNIEYNKERMIRAINNCELSKLRIQEDKNGFKETSAKSDKFFGNGEIDGWRKILTLDQIKKIESNCKSMMKEFGYINEVKNVA